MPHRAPAVRPVSLASGPMLNSVNRRRLGICLALAVSGFAAQTAEAQSTAAPRGRFVDRVYRDAAGDHTYVVFEPAGYSPQQKWPVVLYLHGASGRGRDARVHLVTGLAPAIQAQVETYPFLVVFPQHENVQSRLLGGWNDGTPEFDRAIHILDEVERTYSVDKSHEMVIGASMGGFGVYKAVADFPNRWKAAIPVSGGGEPEQIPSLTKTPIWAFHAAQDEFVPVTRCTELVAAVNKAGGRAYATIVPNSGHSIGAQVLAREEVIAWMRDPRQVPKTNPDWSKAPPSADITDWQPFIPGADVPSAARVKINRDVLESISYVIAEKVPADAMQGWKPGRHEQQQGLVSKIDVSVGGMRYAGQLQSAWITPQQNGTVRLQLGLRNVSMTITSTRLKGALLSARSGPMTIYIGHRAPVWLTIDVLPQVVDRQLKLHAHGVHFQIPNDNWSISRPEVDVRGMPFLENKVADKLVDGIAEKKGMIEAEIRNSVPQMLAQAETRVAALWGKTITPKGFAMPMWMPRIRLYPEAVTVDQSGVDLKLGALVAALAPRSADVPVRSFPAGGETFPATPANGLEVAVSTRLLFAYSTLLATSDVGRFNALDMNLDAFRKLGGHKVWNDALPADKQLADTTEINTELVLAQPFSIRPERLDTDTPDGLRHRVVMVAPRVQAQVATREPGQKAWTSRIVANIAFEQTIDLQFSKPSFSQRRLAVGMGPSPEPKADVRWLESSESLPLDYSGIAGEFWTTLDDKFSHRDGLMKDIAFGQFALRFEDIGATQSHLVVRLARPGVRITNQSTAALEYQVRELATPWSKTLRLEPGKFHEFEPATPLSFRSHSGQAFTLPLGVEAHVRPGVATSAVRLELDGDAPVRR